MELWKVRRIHRRSTENQGLKMGILEPQIGFLAHKKTQNHYKFISEKMLIFKNFRGFCLVSGPKMIILLWMSKAPLALIRPIWAIYDASLQPLDALLPSGSSKQKIKNLKKSTYLDDFHRVLPDHDTSQIPGVNL